MSRIAFVVSERKEGLNPARVARYARARERLSDIVAAQIDVIHYADVDRLDADAAVLSGSYDPWALHDPGALARFGKAVMAYEGPTFGICAGMQLQVRIAGGTVGPTSEPTGPGFATVEVVDDTCLLGALPRQIEVYKDHSDEVTMLPAGLHVLARSDRCAVEAVAADDRPWWGTQFHPEEWTDARPAGRTILARFFRMAAIPVRDESQV